MANESQFSLGRLVATPGALGLEINIFDYVVRHLSGDWGDLDPSDKRRNDCAVKNKERILSSYETPKGKIWIITEWDRSVTTALLPSEY